MNLEDLLGSEDFDQFTPLIPAHEPLHTFLDCGANVGDFTAWVLRGGFPVTDIYAYEAYRPTLETYFVPRFKDDSRVHAIHGAIYPTEAPTMLLRSRGAGDCLSHLVVTLDHQWVPTETYPYEERSPIVHPRALPPCDFLKLDVEGCEVAVLQAYPHLAGVRYVSVDYEERERSTYTALLTDFELILDMHDEYDDGWSGGCMLFRRST